MEIDHTKIDWEMLQKQKQTLIYLAENKRGTRIKYSEAVDITGILHFIDYIQDTAVDGGWVPEERVFKYEDEADDTQ